VIVREPDIVSITRHPPEDYAPLVIDSDAVTAFQIAVQRLQAVPGRGHQILKAAGGVQHIELSQGDGRDARGQFARTLGLATMV
jgi:hypothetical protein